MPLWELFCLIIFFGISNLIFKWGDGVSIFSGRTDPWLFYLTDISERLPMSLLPFFFSEVSLNEKLYSYISSTTGLSHTPHNLFIDFFYRLGIVFGFILILALCLPLFMKRKSREKYAYVGLLTYSMFEPSIGFSTNLISLYFLFLLINLYFEAFYKGGLFENHINSYNQFK